MMTCCGYVKIEIVEMHEDGELVNCGMFGIGERTSWVMGSRVISGLV
jgi:hypothetical protein